MFAYIKGVVTYIGNEEIVIEKDDIGFSILTSNNVTRRLSIGEKVTIHTYLHVKEDDLKLFGFFDTVELEIFKLLISVNGIGPKGALAIMSTLTVSDIFMAVAAEDSKAISKAPGVGAKTAMKAIIELKDKIGPDKLSSKGIAMPEGLGDIVKTASPLANSDSSAMGETIEALESLGYSRSEAMKAISKVDGASEMSTEALLKAALKKMSTI